MKIKIDLHVHSCFSLDSSIESKELVFYAKKRGLDAVAITDHDTITGSKAFAEQTDFPIIPGMEISSIHGHITALGLNGPVRSGLEVDDTIDQIHKRGGIAIACHPVAFFKGSLSRHVSSRFDAIETINASAVPFAYCSRHSDRLGTKLGLPKVGGSDAHYPPEIGHAYTLVEAETEVNSIITSLREGLCEPFGTAIPISIRLRREFYGIRKALKL